MASDYRRVQRSRRNAKQSFRDVKKHFVRLNGWLPVMLESARQTGGHVRYLTLCSKEAIDVRYFAQKGALERNAAKNEYPGLTFIEANEEDYAVIAESLGKYRLGVRGRLEEALLDPAHDFAVELASTFPHDVINLDFCGEILPKTDYPYSATLQCLRRIIELQSFTLRPWHLFLTFAVPSQNADREANPQLLASIDGNLTNQEHRAAYGGRLAPAELLNNDYGEFLRLGIVKVIAHEACHRGYRVLVSRSYWYSRNEDAYRIVKLIIQFAPIRAPGDLPSHDASARAYSESVGALFRSTSVSVDASLSDAVRQSLKADVAPVVAELAQLKIVSD